jgi:hypothetical protein
VAEIEVDIDGPIIDLEPAATQPIDPDDRPPEIVQPIEVPQLPDDPEEP